MGPCGPMGPPEQPTPPVLILAWLSACLSRLTELVKSCRRLMSTSKLMTKASSLARSVFSRKEPPTSFSISRTRIWLPLASIRMPRVSGRSDSALKYLTVWGWPSSNRSKLSLVRLGISAPCLSLTLKNSCTTSTLTFRVSTDWSCDWASELEAELELDVGPVEEVAGGAEGGGAGKFCATAEGDRCVTRASMASAKRPVARHGLQRSLGISVFIPRLC